METVRRYCNRAILIGEGKLLLQGSPQQVADEYSRMNQAQIDKETESRNKTRHSDVRVRTLDENKRAQQSFDTGETMLLEIKWPRFEELHSITIDLFKQSGEHVGGFKSEKDNIKGMAEAESATVSIELNIAPGIYSYQISFRTNQDEEIFTAYDIGQFTVLKNWSRAGKAWSGLVPIDHKWTRVKEGSEEVAFYYTHTED